MNVILYFVIITLHISAFALLATTEGAAKPETFRKVGSTMKNNNTIEEWRTIPAFPNYAVSNLGRIRRLTSLNNTKANKILKPTDRGNGYLFVTLLRRGEKKNISIHQVVAEVFLGASGKLEVNHKNGNKQDNRLENLEYVTRSANAQHSYRLGLQNAEQNRGERNGQAKLKESEVLQIKAVSDRSMQSRKAVALRFNVSPTQIRDIWTGKAWKHLL